MGFDFSGRRAVVAGGSRGIGRATAMAFAAAGADVSICARGEDGLRAAREAIAAHGGVVHAAACELADEAAVARYVEQAAAALGGIDVLVNAASLMVGGDGEDAWGASLGIDVMAVVRACHAAQPWLARSPAPAVVNIGSISGLEPSTRTPAYGAAKAMVSHYTGSLAALWARQGIRVNCIAPGSIEFPGGLWDRRRAAGEPMYERVLRSIPFGRLGHPEEIAEVALFLASPHARWITGQTLVVDGGQTLGA